MKPEQIKALLKEQGATQSDVARVVGVSPATVSGVINGTSKSRMVAMTIAGFLKKDVDVLWPGKYPKVYRRNRRDVCVDLERVFQALKATPAAARATAEV
ncbi:helix-turn-helix domain-containing protein [Methyloversatilis discipulorum]|uniref:helix-turn-helix domain-containing protein n=1 Tax=Methyloversatilis discipulorum TaxID=1119528 RepID=UPI00036F5287|nr:helix-turn-helix domain-containing protein [Methyloversatilis discipulorum]